MVKFSLLYTTARLHLIRSVIDRWFDSAQIADNCEMVIVTDTPVLPLLSHKQVRFIANTGRQDCVTGWNLAAVHAVGEIFIQVSDDLFPPDRWDEAITKEINCLTASRPDVVLNLMDERQCKTAVYHPVITKEAYNHVGYMYPPEFESMYCDNWFMAYHAKYSLYHVGSTIFWTHIHHRTHNVTVDAVARKHESPARWMRGHQLLMHYANIHQLEISRNLVVGPAKRQKRPQTEDFPRSHPKESPEKLE